MTSSVSTSPNQQRKNTAYNHNSPPDKYFMDHLSLSEQDADMLHQKYYKEYGLAIEGLVRYHKVDAMEYNRKVDDALPLDGVIVPNPQLRKMLEDIDKTKVRLWLFTNAYITHGMRVVNLLGIADLFEGITYCDYTQEMLICKPHEAMFDKAEAEAGASSPEDCYFVGKFFIFTQSSCQEGANMILQMTLTSTVDTPKLAAGPLCTFSGQTTPNPL